MFVKIFLEDVWLFSYLHKILMLSNSLYINNIFSFKKNSCIRISRSSPICGSGRTKPRQQLNENTGYIDGSPIYGSSVDDMSKFRDGRTPFLKLQNFNGMRLLPFDQAKCRNSASCTATFIAGDSRVNLFLGLSSYHLLFTREHNRYIKNIKIYLFLE